jgi:hypothetical protein
MTIYTIKRNNADQGFEVSGPDKEWVETQAEAFAQQFTISKSALKKSAESHSTPSSKPTTNQTSVGDGLESLVRNQLDADIIGQMVRFVEARQKAFDKTAPNQAVIIAKFLKDALNIELIDKEDLAYIYKQVGVWKLVNHQNQLANAADRNNYFTRHEGKYKLSYAGEKFALDTAKE